MKKMKKYILITAAILFSTRITFGMEGTAKLKAKYPIPQVELTISNETKDNFVLKAGNKVVTGIKAGDEKNLKIPMKVTSETKVSQFFGPELLKLVNINTQKEYSIDLTIYKGFDISLNTALQRPMTEDEKLDKAMEVLNFDTKEAARKAFKEQGITLKDQPFNLTEIIDKIKVDDLEKTQDSYKIELILKGDNLVESELDYTGSLR